MNRQQHDALFDSILDAHFGLWRILSKTERGSHRMLLATADDQLCQILQEMKDTRPEGLTLVKEGGR